MPTPTQKRFQVTAVHLQEYSDWQGESWDLQELTVPKSTIEILQQTSIVAHNVHLEKMYREENECSLTMSPWDTSSFWRTWASPLSTSGAVISNEEKIFKVVQTSPHIALSTRKEKSATAAGLKRYLCSAHILEAASTTCDGPTAWESWKGAHDRHHTVIIQAEDQLLILFPWALHC